MALSQVLLLLLYFSFLFCRIQLLTGLISNWLPFICHSVLSASSEQKLKHYCSKFNENRIQFNQHTILTIKNHFNYSPLFSDRKNKVNSVDVHRARVMKWHELIAMCSMYEVSSIIDSNANINKEKYNKKSFEVIRNFWVVIWKLLLENKIKVAKWLKRKYALQ